VTPILIYGSALVLGSVHALEADHVSAVTAFAVNRPRVRSALGFGFRWAIGHGTAVIGIGTALLVLRSEIPHGVVAVLERLVGLALVMLGAWTAWSARKVHAHAHHHADGTAHVHVHSHALSRRHDHRHAATAVGLLHGAAGAAPAVALVPVAHLDGNWAGVLFLLLFAIGTVAGMTLYALLAGAVVGRAAEASVRLGRALARLAGAGTIAVGLLWLLR
jgi:hypothetical protein